MYQLGRFLPLLTKALLLKKQQNKNNLHLKPIRLENSRNSLFKKLAITFKCLTKQPNLSLNVVQLRTPRFRPFCVPRGLGLPHHYSERQASITWATEGLGCQPRLRFSQRGWISDQATTQTILPKSSFFNPKQVWFCHELQFSLHGTHLISPPPIGFSFHPLGQEAAKEEGSIPALLATKPPQAPGSRK